MGRAWPILAHPGPLAQASSYGLGKCRVIWGDFTKNGKFSQKNGGFMGFHQQTWGSKPENDGLTIEHVDAI
jgi:hypothetical protein